MAASTFSFTYAAPANLTQLMTSVAELLAFIGNNTDSGMNADNVATDFNLRAHQIAANSVASDRFATSPSRPITDATVEPRSISPRVWADEAVGEDELNYNSALVLRSPSTGIAVIIGLEAELGKNYFAEDATIILPETVAAPVRVSAAYSAGADPSPGEYVLVYGVGAGATEDEYFTLAGAGTGTVGPIVTSWIAIAGVV